METTTPQPSAMSYYATLYTRWELRELCARCGRPRMAHYDLVGCPTREHVGDRFEPSGRVG